MSDLARTWESLIKSRMVAVDDGHLWLVHYHRCVAKQVVDSPGTQCLELLLRPVYRTRQLSVSLLACSVVCWRVYYLRQVQLNEALHQSPRRSGSCMIRYVAVLTEPLIQPRVPIMLAEGNPSTTYATANCPPSIRLFMAPKPRSFARLTISRNKNEQINNSRISSARGARRSVAGPFFGGSSLLSSTGLWKPAMGCLYPSSSA